MSKATKRKYVTQEVCNEFVLPDGTKKVVKVVASKGNNLHEVENENGNKFLVSMPTKFRKNVWIKRGDFVLIEAIEEGDKVKGEIVNILYKDQVKYIKENNLWPEAFTQSKKSSTSEADDGVIPRDMLPPSDSESSLSESSDDDFAPSNPNRAPVCESDDD